MLALGVAVLIAGTAWRLAPDLLNRDSGPVKGDVLVVLGGGWVDRSQRAAQLYAEHAAPLLVITGAGDCETNRSLLLRYGVPAQAIQTECHSHNSKENAQFTVELLRKQHARRVILVTTWYHSRRALACFRHFAPDMQFYSRPSYYGYPYGEWLKKGMATNVGSEYVKLLYYWLRYGICPA